MKLCVFVSLLDNAPNYVSWVHPNRSQHSKFWNVSLDNFPNYWGVQFHPACQTPILIQGSLIYPLPYGPLSPNYYILLHTNLNGPDSFWQHPSTFVGLQSHDKVWLPSKLSSRRKRSLKNFLCFQGSSFWPNIGIYWIRFLGGIVLVYVILPAYNDLGINVSNQIP